MSAEKPLLLALNVVASIALGLGVSHYMTGWLDRREAVAKHKTPPSIHQTKQAQQLASSTALKEAAPSLTPTITPLPTVGHTSQQTITPTPYPKAETKTRVDEEFVSPTLTPTPTHVVTTKQPDTTPTPTPPASEQPPQDTTHTPNRSVNGVIHNAATSVLEALPHNK